MNITSGQTEHGWYVILPFVLYFANMRRFQSSVRHNLSSSRDKFRKMERCGGDKGKGFYWSVDEKYIPIYEELELKTQPPGR